MPLAALLALSAAASGTEGPPLPSAELVAGAAKRFPQPVRVGSLTAREVLAPDESQPVLGRVAGAVRRSDGGAALLIDLRTWFGWGGRRVAVPIEAVALLGEHVAMLGFTRRELDALPTWMAGEAPAIGADDTIRVGLVKPFH